MNSYSKIRHAPLDLQAETNPTFSHSVPVSENPALSSFESKQWKSGHGAAATFRRSQSSACHRLGEEEQMHAIGLQAALRRAFSLRRASFIDNGYCRMRDRSDRFLAEEEDEGEANRGKERRGRRGSRRKGFVGLCKKLVGF